MKYEECKIGMRVFFPGDLVVGACHGTVVKIYPPDEEQPAHATVKVDRPLPAYWPYGNWDTGDLFCPEISELERG